MLKSIHAKNIALIREEEINFSDGLNILTGETGAGKSILLGSVNIALGTASFRDYVSDGDDYALVELVFETDSSEVAAMLDEYELPQMDSQVIITRKYSNGRTVSRVNGETVPIDRVRRIASLLIDLHGQHEHQSLLKPANHLKLLDAFAGEKMNDLLEACAESCHAWSSAKKKLDEALLDETQRLKKIDFLGYEIQEIDEAVLTAGEDDELEARHRLLSNSQKISQVLEEASALTDSDEGAAMAVSRCAGALTKIADFDESLSSLSEEASSLESLMDDFTRSLRDCLETFVYDEEELVRTENRLDLINRLKVKYGRTIEDILAYRDRSEEELNKLQDFENYKASLGAEAEKAKRNLKALCEKITALRTSAAGDLKVKITESLSELNFPDVKFEISISPLSEMTSHGADEVVFMISTNPGMPVRPISQVASGGELSRIMLGIKTVMASQGNIGTLIFDEIDSGISGRTAQKVSEKMVQLSRSVQVIAITHLAQIAAMADHHYLIEKSVKGDSTFTGVRKLDADEKVEELARILGGAQITDAVRQNAREMLELAAAFKKN